ncbi:hypothetical protein FRC09_003954 [Ceratobasidium sp. 395]|nr:hypothetical protein FRC09_003954 [Ceratobasidium sp. 395]
MPPSRRARRGRGGRPYYRSRSSSLSVDDEAIKVDPNALYTCVDQVWDPYSYNDWATKKHKPPSSQISANGRLIFKAYDRVYGSLGPSIDDHMWIDLESNDLAELLRSEESLKGAGNLLDNQPGIDARELFLRLPRLTELAVEPAAEDDIVLVSAHPSSPSASPPRFDDPPTSAPAPESESTSDPSAADPAAMEIDPGANDPTAFILSDAEDDPPAPTKPPLPVPEQLYILVKFIEEHFKETAAELERLKKEGYISFKLLWMLCTPGSVVEVSDEATGDPAGMKVESWGYGSDGKTFSVKGIKYVWDGKIFKQEQTQVGIHQFRGFTKLSEIPIKVLSDQCSKAKGRVMIDVAGYYQFNLDAMDTRVVYNDDWDDSGKRVVKHTVAEYKSSEPLPDEVLCLTPPSLYGWSFRAKIWGLIHVEHVEEIVFDDMAFEQLVLKKSYKKMIKALVETHAGKEEGLAKDLIAGKGGGMVMVLHGKPGTGKTLTAEAISEHLKCPLYVVSSGELGVDASQLETQLKDILEMTATWGAVVLIDEADVFLEARDTHDLARNCLVSVFLRLLEYHKGVLILTTNRIRSFDRAFVSRFTIALNYPDLDQGSRLLVWKEFLRRAGFEFGDPNDSAPSRPLYIAHSDLMAVANKPFNGRVIKQLVRGAQALAIAEKEPLELSHIHTVLEITEQFEADWEDTALVADVKGAGVSTLS